MQLHDSAIDNFKNAFRKRDAKRRPKTLCEGSIFCNAIPASNLEDCCCDRQRLVGGPAFGVPECSKWRTLEPKCSFKMGRFFLNPLSFGSQGLGGWKGDDSSSSPLRAESLFASTRTKFLIEILSKKSFEIFMILLLDHSSCPTGIGPDVVVWYCHTPSYLGSLEAWTSQMMKAGKRISTWRLDTESGMMRHRGV